MHLKTASVLVLLCLATAMHAYAVDYICFESQEKCNKEGALLNVEWIMAVQHHGDGDVDVWFDGWPGIQGAVHWPQVNWDSFLRHVIQKQNFKKFANFYIKERHLRRVACSSEICRLKIHPHSIELEGSEAVAVRAYITEQAEAGRIMVIPSK